MQECLKGSGCQAYSEVYMKQKLNEGFGDEIIITQLNGKSDIVTICTSASSIMFQCEACGWKECCKYLL